MGVNAKSMKQSLDVLVKRTGGGGVVGRFGGGGDNVTFFDMSGSMERVFIL